jgi:hypothetical protein
MDIYLHLVVIMIVISCAFQFHRLLSEAPE